MKTQTLRTGSVKKPVCHDLDNKTVPEFILIPYDVDKNHVTTFADVKLIKRTKIRNRYNQVPHLAQDTNGKATNLQLDITNESQEVSPFPAGDHNATINRRTQKHSKHTAEIT